MTVTILAGCAAGPDFKRPIRHRQIAYTAQLLKLEAKDTSTGDASAQQVIIGEQLDQAWWQLFQSDALNGVVKRALAQNRTIIAAGYTLAQAQESPPPNPGRSIPRLA